MVDAVKKYREMIIGFVIGLLLASVCFQVTEIENYKQVAHNNEIQRQVYNHLNDITSEIRSDTMGLHEVLPKLFAETGKNSSDITDLRNNVSQIRAYMNDQVVLLNQIRVLNEARISSEAHQ